MAPILNWEIALAGDQSVGKTSMVIRFAKNKFTDFYQSTVVVDHLFRMVKLHDTDIKLQIWDTAGQEVYKAIVPQYFRRAQGCILVYDLTNVTTFHSLSDWLLKFREYNETAPVVIVGNKNDSNYKAVNRTIVKSFADQEGISFTECSAKSGENVDEAFELLLEMIWQTQFPKTETRNDYKTLETDLSHCHQVNENSCNPRWKEPIGHEFLEEKKEVIRLSQATKNKSKKRTCPC